MRVFVPILALAAGLAACGAPEAPAAKPDVSVSVEPAPLDPSAPAAEKAALAACAPVTAEGYCGVKFGASPDEAKAKFPVKLETYDSDDPNAVKDANHCFEMFAAEPVQGVSFLVETNKVGRVDFLNEGPKTADGFGVGSAATEIKGKFGAAAAEGPNKYEPEITDLTVTQGAAKYVFEIEKGNVRSWRAGVAPTIDYVEHCS